MMGRDLEKEVVFVFELVGMILRSDEKGEYEWGRQREITTFFG